MADFKRKHRAIILRKKGYSYSQIKTTLGVSKGTLSEWLRPYPLSAERIRELQGDNPQRIERYRNTMAKKRQAKLDVAFSKAKKAIGNLSKRELFIAGFFLYWGEGTKASQGIVVCTNTDPSMIRFFIKWLRLIGVPKDKLKVKLHLYVDMSIKKETTFWSDVLGIPKENFKNPYIKESKFSDLTYKSGFGHGTCNLYYANVDIHNQVMMSLKYLRYIV